ncbi:hypothetical protein OLMES_0482 [Oleiphilus messinensis]|uniref:DUF6792 domain-containing protein n=1 Tax=Oleiphilus messinensis TaxID=141451 RepID=A0A1Y0I474_9GAMM|nr:DUF6792 domain-containing protein [Oleiphilus messinensis]ARU54586.1 hypothetical protein OLMES_0482 [Oleiphilus messinensis]
MIVEHNDTGELWLVNGTELLGTDILADISLTFTGEAGGQVRDMLEFYQEAVQNGVISATDQLNVPGHSLGGHLTAYFTLLNGKSVNHAYTFNGAGIDETPNSLTDWNQLIKELVSLDFPLANTIKAPLIN